MKPYYQDEWVQLFHGDALAVLKELPSGSIDALITDPPYSSGGMHRSDRNVDTRNKYLRSEASREAATDFSGDSRDQRSYQYWCALWLAECMRITRPGGVALMFTDWRQLPATTDALQSGGWVWRGIVPWYKPTARPSAGRFTAHCEYVVWGSNGSMGMDLSEPCFPGFYQASPPRERDHITQKPLDVMRQLVKIAPIGGTVLDPFMGAGTTGAATIIEGRKFIGIEMVHDYARIAERRIRLAEGTGLHTAAQEALVFDEASA